MTEIFYEKQWSVHVPVFDFGSSENQRPIHYQFDEGTIMPWVSLGKKIETGGYGTVEKLKIHPGHCHSVSPALSYIVCDMGTQNTILDSP
jgi:hypothetical protein